jgi:hypothetical protein
MRKLFIVLIIIVFCSSCKDEQLPTTYQIFNSSNRLVTNINYLDGSMYEVIVYHYSGTKIIQQDSFDKIATAGGKTGLMDVPANTDLIKLSFKFLPPESPFYNDPWNARYYMIDYKMITRGDNNIFGINGGSYISDTIVKSNNNIDFLQAIRTLNEKPIDTF